MAEAFTWGSGGEREDSSTRARRRLAEAMIARGTSTDPVQHWTQGVARVAQALSGGLMLREEDQRDRASADMLANHPYLQGAPTYGGTPPVTSTGMSKSIGQTDPNNMKIYRGDEPSPLDPPSGQDLDMATRTVLAEAGNQSPEGQLAVANVIRKRTLNPGYGGDTIPGVVQAPNQFEPWNTQGGRDKMAAIDPNSAKYRLASALVDRAYTGNDDPTNGATHFYAPKAQAALGRPAPAWDNGTGRDIGDHRFFGGVQSADSGALPPNAQLTQGVAQQPPGQPAQSPIPPETQIYIKGLLANPRTRAAGVQMLNQYAAPSNYSFSALPDGTIVRQDPRRGTVQPVYQGQTKPTFGEIGTDPNTGQPMRGFIDPTKRSVEPYTVPGTQHGGESVIPPVPAGVDPKVWREAHSKRAVSTELGASSDDVSKLRGEVRQLPSYKAMAEVGPRFQSMQTAAARDNRAADLTLVYGLMKILDPTSVVRESEAAMAQNIATLPENYRAQVQSFLTGQGRLAPDVRAAIMQEAHGAALSYQDQFERDVTQYRGIVTRNKMNVDDVIPSFAPLTPAQAAPQTGADVLSGKVKRFNPKTGQIE